MDWTFLESDARLPNLPETNLFFGPEWRKCWRLFLVSHTIDADLVNYYLYRDLIVLKL